ncbi:MAG: Aminodeoxychorismate lyase [Candidatus Amesbacteria bacterium GW2011_GWB1_47_19]|nr:MAG: Aminodeoxychorismate lyase [Candidatus Amesbacteria bacterium GW2011_GWA1_44_24]KKU31052.1 MAG: Aminodeoxychorismate lyase [Candidatus Amesbacteria bacterium GW2011_GWC1_46_24]KKU66668.1 MAG: Aminodeoxychorismate lyase [Candidatus Amesbacteria bacterium GW2011_GWB1_47_19]OGD06131.1 MAG: hypothetical protein A2379_03505 [Candidatus Amesbacteria bacterium RIFOXYB1_FULL_47_13]HBC72273.1 endolytic transglycosylase MltG [Candidatus Amesbacteria bacterium]
MKLFWILIISLFLIFAASAGVFFYWRYLLSPLSPASGGQVTFVVNKNQSAGSVLQELEKSGLIRSALAAKIHLRLHHLDNSLRPGGFLLSARLSAPDIISHLISGPGDIWVTIPEGWRREQIAGLLSRSLTGSGSSFDPGEFMMKTVGLEGQLFPDTYLVPQSADATQVITLMTGNFSRKSDLVLPENYPDLIMASLIEREAKSPADRLLISGILKKRLDDGMPLQVDASIQYAQDLTRCLTRPLVCDWWQPVTSTRVPSSYNTYLHSGLPPTPIANPGLAAINASLHPQDSPYWYYLTGNDGVTRYARDLSEHNSNIDKYLRL